MGFLSLIVQVILTRELLTVFSGNELDIGITLGFWLLWVGLGSLLGGRLGLGPRAFGISWALVSALAFPTLVVLWWIRPIIGVAPGEVVSLSGTVMSTALVLAPICLTIGMQYPFAVAFFSADGEGAQWAPGRVYGLESLGAFISGVLFVFVLSGRVDSWHLISSVFVLCCLLSIMMGGGRWALLSMVLVALMLLSVPGVFFKPSGLYVGSVNLRAQSKYGQLVVTSLEGQTNLYSSGKLVFSYPPSDDVEIGLHMPISVHPDPRRVLLVGGGPAMARDALVGYAPEILEYVESDPRLLELSMVLWPEFVGGAIEYIAEDARGYIKSQDRARYDMVVVTLPPPDTANLNRFYTREFFAELRRVLNPGGVLSIAMPTSSGYVGREKLMSTGSVYNSLRSVFAFVGISTEQYGLLFASDGWLDLSAKTLSERFTSRTMGVSAAVTPSVFMDAFEPLRTGMYLKRLSTVETLNTDLRPSAYLYNLRIWASAHGGQMMSFILSQGVFSALIIGVIFILLGAVCYGRPQASIKMSTFSMGFAAMAVTIAIILSYQSAFGYVYERFGLLSAMFMAGAALGALWAKKARMAIGVMVLIELAALALTLAIGSLGQLPEFLYFSFCMAAGVIAGSQFALASGMLKGKAPVLYALDLAGSFIGAIAISLLLMPVIGLRGTMYLIAGIKLLVAGVLFVVRDEKSLG